MAEKRIGSSCQQTFEREWMARDASDESENAEVFAMMRTAVSAAHEAAGICSNADFERRLAYLLKWLYFSGGTTARGCAAYITTMVKSTGNSRRTICRLLARARELSMVTTQPGPRSSLNRLEMVWIRSLVAEHRRKVAQHRRKVAQCHPNTDMAQCHSGTVPPEKWHSDRERVFKENLERARTRATSDERSTWDEFAVMVGHEEAARIQRAIDGTPMSRLIAKAKATGDTLGDFLWDAAIRYAKGKDTVKPNDSTSMARRTIE